VAAVFTLTPEAGESFFTVNGLDTAALDRVVAAIEHLAGLRQFDQVSRHGVLYKLSRCSPRLCGKLLKARFGLGFEAEFHSASLEACTYSVNDHAARATVFAGS
jgi:hypothetical protein